MSKGIEDARDGSSIIDMMREYGALKPTTDTRPMEEILKEAMGTADNTGIMRKLGDLFNPFGNSNVGNKLFQGGDEAIRASVFRNALEAGSTPQEAADFVNQVAGNWKDVSPTEKSLFQAMYPYYSWFKTNTKLQFGTWLTNPQRQLLPIKVWNMLNEEAAGVPLWQNDTGAGWKIATGQKNAKGEMIYVTPAVSTNLVPELIQGGAQGLLNKVISGPIPTAATELTTGKSPYQTLYGISGTSAPFADEGAPFADRLANFVLNEFSPQGTDVVGGGTAKNVPQTLIKTLTGWDAAHPMWENIIETFLQSYTAPVEQSWIQNYYQTEAYKKYTTDLTKYKKKMTTE